MNSLKNECDNYARDHTVMMTMLVVFFGALVVPFLNEKVQYGSREKTYANVNKLLYKCPCECKSCNKNIKHHAHQSFVEIKYKYNGKEYTKQEHVPIILSEGQRIEIYVDPSNPMITSYKSNSIAIYITLYAFYLIIVSLCIYLLTTFVFGVKK